jgi:hypothetical protein
MRPAPWVWHPTSIGFTPMGGVSATFDIIEQL